jgi:hypothetical protein
MGQVDGERPLSSVPIFRVFPATQWSPQMACGPETGRDISKELEALLRSFEEKSVPWTFGNALA